MSTRKINMSISVAVPAPRNNEPLHEGIGPKLRLRRKVKNLSLREVALRSGVSVGQISHIERGLSMPSMRSLHRVCGALDMPMGWLFEGEAEAGQGVVVRASSRRRLELDGMGITKELLTPDACPDIQMLRIVIRPGGGTGDQPYNQPAGAKCALVQAGTLGLEVDGSVLALSPGDSFAIDSRKMIRFWCEGDQPCELIWTVTPALY